MTTDNSRVLGYYETLRKPWNIPPFLQRYTCLCKREDLYLPVGIKPAGKDKYWVCIECSKLPIYHFFQCFECEKPFLRDFRHPKFCTVDPLCWDCLTSTGPICDCVRPKVAELLGEVPPYLPKPKQFTPEELDSVFDF